MDAADKDSTRGEAEEIDAVTAPLSLRARILRYLLQHQPCVSYDIWQALGAKRCSVSWALLEMERVGIIRRGRTVAYRSRPGRPARMIRLRVKPTCEMLSSNTSGGRRRAYSLAPRRESVPRCRATAPAVVSPVVVSVAAERQQAGIAVSAMSNRTALERAWAML